MSVKVVIALNTAWNLFNFRSGLIRALVAQGYEVVAVAPYDEYAPQLQVLGCRYIHLFMDNHGTHPGREILLLIRFLRLLRAERPGVFLGYTVKPNIYGSLAAHILKIPVINNISGLGAVFIKDGWLNKLVSGLYRICLSRSSKVFFQNKDDRDFFILNQVVNENISDILPGSGVDLKFFKPTSLPSKPRVRFLLIARMLWEKGVGEYVEAARILRRRGVQADFRLLGFVDENNPSAVSRKQLDVWVAEGIVQYLGVSNDVRGEISGADCVVLPSFYPEGTPRTLLEAAAMARPIVTTDTVGCRNVVDDGITGYLCKAKNAIDLADKMVLIYAMSCGEREMMGLRGRAKVECEFDEKIVIQKYLASIEIALATR